MRAYIDSVTREFRGVCALPYAPPGCELCDSAAPEGFVFGAGVARVLREGEWVEVADHRGQLWHDPETLAEIEIDALGVVPPAGYVQGAAHAEKGEGQ